MRSMPKTTAAPEPRTARKMINLRPHEWAEIEIYASLSKEPVQDFMRASLLVGARARDANRRRRKGKR